MYKLETYISVAKGLKPKVGKFWGLILTFVEVTWGKLVRWAGDFRPPLALYIGLNIESNDVLSHKKIDSVVKHHRNLWSIYPVTNSQL